MGKRFAGEWEDRIFGMRAAPLMRRERFTRQVACARFAPVDFDLASFNAN